MLKHALLSSLLLVLWLIPAHAQSTFEVPVTGELLAGWQHADGTRTAAIRLRLEPGWKTYWRSPGEGGIPPRISWKKSRNLRSVAIIWPTPEVFHQSGMRSIGYRGDIILPVRLAPKRAGKKMQLAAELDIGICRDICVPHQMTLNAVVDDSNTQVTPEIAAALAATRRGSSTRIRRSSNHGTASSARGTAVVLPAPGGACRTASSRPARASSRLSSTSLMGRSGGTGFGMGQS